MNRFALLLAFAPTALAAQDITTPSGLEATIAEVIMDDETDTMRLRLVATALADGAAETIAEDMIWICDTQVIPALAANGLTPAHVVISLADRPVTFGESDPDAVQVFDSYTVADGACTWELY